MVIFYNLTSQDDLNLNERIYIIVAPPGLHDLSLIHIIQKKNKLR